MRNAKLHGGYTDVSGWVKQGAGSGEQAPPNPAVLGGDGWPLPAPRFPLPLGDPTLRQ